VDDPDTVDVMVPAVEQEAAQSCLGIFAVHAMQVQFPLDREFSLAQFCQDLVLHAGAFEKKFIAGQAMIINHGGRGHFLHYGVCISVSLHRDGCRTWFPDRHADVFYLLHSADTVPEQLPVSIGYVIELHHHGAGLPWMTETL
jgi:hypothetical protein